MKLVRDIYPGRKNSTPAFLTAVGGRVFFGAQDGVDGIGPWNAAP